MLASISINYKGKPITIEDMLQQARFLKKLKIPFVCTVAVIFLLVVMRAVTKHYGIIQVPSIILAAVVVLNWLACAGGFVIYGRRLVTLMPNSFSSKVR